MNEIKRLPGTCKALGLMLSTTHRRRRSRKKKSKSRNSKGQRRRRGEKGRKGRRCKRKRREGGATDPDSAAGPSPSHPPLKHRSISARKYIFNIKCFLFHFITDWMKHQFSKLCL